MKSCLLLFNLLYIFIDSLDVSINLSNFVSPKNETINLIKSSKNEIYGLIYKFSDKDIYEELRNKINNNVKVSLIVDDKENNYKNSYSNRIKNLGAYIYFYNYTKLHAKFACFDNKACLTGSFNWSEEGINNNLELVIKISNYLLVQDMKKLWNDIN